MFYLSLFSIFLFFIFVSYLSIAVKINCGARPQRHGAASRDNRQTDKDIVHYNCGIINVVPAICFLELSYLASLFVFFFPFFLQRFFIYLPPFHFYISQTHLLIQYCTLLECQSSKELWYHFCFVDPSPQQFRSHVSRKAILGPQQTTLLTIKGTLV